MCGVGGVCGWMGVGGWVSVWCGWVGGWMCVWVGVVCVHARVCACVRACVWFTLPKDSVVFGLFQICDSIKSRPTINICNILINMIRQNIYVSAVCYETKYSLLLQ